MIHALRSDQRTKDIPILVFLPGTYDVGALVAFSTVIRYAQWIAHLIVASWLQYMKRFPLLELRRVAKVLPIQCVCPRATKFLEDNGYRYTQLSDGVAGFKKNRHEISENELLAMGLAVNHRGTWNDRVISRRQEQDFLNTLKQIIK
jgi:hypothetical protein